jgi:hypothetical protein
MIKGYVNIVPLTYVTLMSLLSFDMSDCTLAAKDKINNLLMRNGFVLLFRLMHDSIP